ncbi:MAG: alpha/beta fold hydrolase [Thermohalobaculum sp.]
MPTDLPATQPNSRTHDTARWHAARRYARTSYGDIAYHESGQGPALLLLHGFPLNAYQWRDVMDLLSGERRCIAPDLLGLGYSRPAPDADIGLVAQADMLAELLDCLGIDQADVIANDSGTAIAQLLVVNHPGTIRSMLLTNGDVEPDSPPEPLLPVIELARQGAFAEAMVGAALADKTMARSAEGVIGLTFSNPQNVADEAIDLYFAPLIETPERVALTNKYAASLLPNPLLGLEKRLRTVTVPTAILWGTGDKFFKPSNVDYLRGVLPNLKQVRHVDGAALFFPEEHPELVAEAVRDLWAASASTVP